MDSVIQLLFTISSCLCAFILFFYRLYRRTPSSKNPLPRAGGALPIIGHLHHFGGGKLTHKTLAAMAEEHGPAFAISLGSRQTLVVSSWEMAKECFTTLDKVFADRPKIAATEILAYGSSMFAFAAYGPYWRRMRKIATLELLSHKRIAALANMRAGETRAALKELYDSCAACGPGLEARTTVDMKRWFDDLTMNAFVRMVGGKRSVVAENEQKLMRDYFYYFGMFVLSDAIPSLAWLDLQGHKRNMRRIAIELDRLIGGWLEEHKERRKEEKKKKTGDESRVVDQDFMDVMLMIMETEDFPEFEADTIIKSTCLNIVLGGTDTIMVTLTWALSLLLNNPNAMSKAREEVDAHVAKERHVEESDVQNLVYLEAVVKEALRLYPAAPIIGMHSASEDCTLGPDGYHVPSGTRLIVNIWKIQRDEKLWVEPQEFRPERFLTSHKDMDMKGNNFEFIPFGSGRRSCPGTALALRVVHFTLASLLHCFEFVKPSDEDIDMTESPGITNMKATPLEVFLAPRLRPEIFTA